MVSKLLLLICTLLSATYIENEELQLKISHSDNQESGKREEKVPLLVVLHGTSEILRPLTEFIRKDLEATNQISMKIITGAQPTSTESITQHFNDGYAFVVYLGMEEGENEVRSRLYNTLDVAMVHGKKWHKREHMSVWAHHIAHALWQEIIGTKSSFLSSIVYATKDYNRTKQVHSSLVVTDWDGSRARTIVTRKTHIVAPCWLPTTTTKDSIIIFSEFTPVNVRLMKVSAHGSPAEIVFNRGGTTVGVSAGSGNDIIYCRSGVIWRYQYDALLHQSLHVPIIHEKEPCACPVMLNNGDVIYCCQGKIKRWDARSKTTEVLTNQGFCTSPAFHEDRNILIFSRKIKGTFQLILKNMSSGIEQQLTHDAGNKIDPTVSPCGFFVAYTLEHGKKSSIHILNLSTGKAHEISNPSQFCMCPAWSN